MEFPVDELRSQITAPCLFSTIAVCQIDPETRGLMENLYDEASQYREAISRSIKTFHTAEYPSNDLMRYFKLPDDPQRETAIKRKVRSAEVDVTAVGEKLYAKLELELTMDLTGDEMDTFTGQIENQYKSGWGEAFEQVDAASGGDCIFLRLWHDDIAFCTDMASMAFQERSQPAPVMNQDSFWTLIDHAKKQAAPNEWLMEQLADRGPEQAKTFDTIARVYMDLAYQYGLWTAASVMGRNGCSDDGFVDFRQWLVAQGKDVYLAALKDPDSLADAPPYHDWQYDSLPRMGDYAYEELTGRNAFEDFDPDLYDTLEAELKKDIVYGEGIGYPYDWQDAPAYLPRLCSKYLSAEQLDVRTGSQRYAWNLNNPELQAARRNAKKSERVRKTKGNAR